MQHEWTTSRRNAHPIVSVSNLDTHTWHDSCKIVEKLAKIVYFTRFNKIILYVICLLKRSNSRGIHRINSVTQVDTIVDGMYAVHHSIDDFAEENEHSNREKDGKICDLLGFLEQMKGSAIHSKKVK